MQKEKRIAYAKFFEAVDCYQVGDCNQLFKLASCFYSASMLADPATVDLLRKVFFITKSQESKKPFDTDLFLAVKGKLFAAIQNEFK